MLLLIVRVFIIGVLRWALALWTEKVGSRQGHSANLKKIHESSKSTVLKCFNFDSLIVTSTINYIFEEWHVLGP